MATRNASLRVAASRPDKIAQRQEALRKKIREINKDHRAFWADPARDVEQLVFAATLASTIRDTKAMHAQAMRLRGTLRAKPGTDGNRKRGAITRTLIMNAAAELLAGNPRMTRADAVPLVAVKVRKSEHRVLALLKELHLFARRSRAG